MGIANRYPFAFKSFMFEVWNEYILEKTQLDIARKGPVVLAIDQGIERLLILMQFTTF